MPQVAWWSLGIPHHKGQTAWGLCGKYMWEASLRAPEKPSNRGKGSDPRDLERAVGHEGMAAQQLLVIAIQMVVGRTSLHKAGAVEPPTPALPRPSLG